MFHLLGYIASFTMFMLVDSEPARGMSAFSAIIFGLLAIHTAGRSSLLSEDEE